MTTVLSVIVGLIIVIGGLLFAQNQNPKIELGLSNGKLKEIPTKPNCVSTETSQKEKSVKALALKDSLEASKKAMKKALSSYGDIEIKKESDEYIYAVATTGTMKYHDDIEIYFDKKNDKVQYRSASRAGYSDRGLNKERYDAIVKVYEQQ